MEDGKGDATEVATEGGIACLKYAHAWKEPI
jgi:hypothetical protein